MRYRLLKELPFDVCFELVFHGSGKTVVDWVEHIGDRDRFRMNWIDMIGSWGMISWWAKHIGDIGYYRLSLLECSKPENSFKHYWIYKWNALYKGTKYEIPSA